MKVVISDFHPYGSLVRVGSHQIAAELRRRGAEVSWLAHPRSWVHTLLGRGAPAIRRHEDGVVEVSPRALLPYVRVPGLGSEWWGRHWLRRRAAARLFEEGGLLGADLLWVSDFTQLPVIDLLAAERVVFRFFDHIDRFRWMPASIFRLVRAYGDRADLVLASSRSVQDQLRDEGLEATYFPNGASPRRFSSVREVEPDPVPRAIYVGALEEWFDLAAVEHWAAGMPGVRFDIAGPNRHGLRSRLPNVRFLGPVPYAEVPRLLAGARFGLIPFRVYGLTLGVHPLKMYDYLAAGLPVLSADLPEVPGDRSGIFKYRNPSEGLEVLRRHLDGRFDTAALRRMAADNSWSHRLAPVLDRLGLASATAAEA